MKRRNQRLPAAIYATPGHSCSFTVRCAPGTSPFSHDTYTRIAVQCLLGQQEKSDCRLDVYCVMPDHIHLIVTPLHEGSSSLTFVDRFKGWCSREIHLAGWHGALWQQRSYDHVIRNEEDLKEIAAYMLANPVRAGLVAEPDEYPWSGMPGLGAQASTGKVGIETGPVFTGLEALPYENVDGVGGVEGLRR